jgi:restriction endonuclease S subunit
MEIKDLDKNTEISFLPMTDLNAHNINFKPKLNKKISDVYTGYTYFKDNDVLLARVTPCFENGKSGVAKNLNNGIGFGSSEYIVFRPNEKILSKWIYYNISSFEFLKSGKNHMSGTGGLQRLTKNFINSYKIPVPSVEIQKEIIKEFDEIETFVEGNKKLIKIYTEKIELVINSVWNK